jgi:hypothetical protein
MMQDTRYKIKEMDSRIVLACEADTSELRGLNAINCERRFDLASQNFPKEMSCLALIQERPIARLLAIVARTEPSLKGEGILSERRYCCGFGEMAKKRKCIFHL